MRCAAGWSESILLCVTQVFFEFPFLKIDTTLATKTSSGAHLWTHQWLIMSSIQVLLLKSIHLNNSIISPSGPACLLFLVVLNAVSYSSNVKRSVLNSCCRACMASFLLISWMSGLLPCFLSRYDAIVSALSFGGTRVPSRFWILINCGWWFFFQILHAVPFFLCFWAFPATNSELYPFYFFLSFVACFSICWLDLYIPFWWANWSTHNKIPCVPRNVVSSLLRFSEWNCGFGRCKNKLSNLIPFRSYWGVHVSQKIIQSLIETLPFSVRWLAKSEPLSGYISMPKEFNNVMVRWEIKSPCEFRGGTWMPWFYNLKLKVHRFRQVGLPTQSQHLPISSLQNHDTNPHQTRSLESCKNRAPRILLGSHFFHKLTPTKSPPGPPAHIGHFKKSRPQGCTGCVLAQLCPLQNQNTKGPQWPLQNHSPHCFRSPGHI